MTEIRDLETERSDRSPKGTEEKEGVKIQKNENEKKKDGKKRTEIEDLEWMIIEEKVLYHSM